jgi:hypothetical protein
MAAVVDSDYSIATNGDIRYTGTTTNNTVIEFHRWLGDKMDDALAAGNDLLDITDATASERSTDNIITLKAPYNIDDTTAQHLFDGSIIQDNGNTIYDGMLVLANAGMYLSIVQNGALATNFWTTGLNADATNGISHRFMLKVRTAGADIDGRRIIGQTREFGFSYSEFKINGTSRGNNVLALTYVTDLNNQTVEGTVAGWTTITNQEGYRGIVIGGTTYYFYSEWNRATYTINQFYERMKWVTRRGTSEIIYPAVTGLNGELFRGITHEVALTGQGVTDWSAVEAVSWSGGTGRMLAVDDINASTKMWIQLLTGVAPTNTQAITGGSSGATANASGTATERTLSFPFIGASTGSAIIGGYGVGIESADLTASDKLFDLTNTQRTPPNNVTFTVSGLVSGEDRVLVGPLGREFAYDGETGTAFVRGETLTFSGGGTAYLSFLRDDGTTGRMQVRMLTGTVPLDNETITGAGAAAAVNGTPVASEDPRQLTLKTTLSGAGETAVVCNQTIPSDTPSTGTIRIQLNSGIYRNVAYTSYATDTFVIGSTNFVADNATGGVTEATANSVFIAYIDKLAASTSEAFTGVYSADRLLFIRVRDGAATPIKTFETTGTLGSAGGSSTAIRTSDL